MRVRVWIDGKLVYSGPAIVEDDRISWPPNLIPDDGEQHTVESWFSAEDVG